jgi:hypothetical protein
MLQGCYKGGTRVSKILQECYKSVTKSSIDSVTLDQRNDDNFFAPRLCVYYFLKITRIVVSYFTKSSMDSVTLGRWLSFSAHPVCISTLVQL